VSKFCGFLAVMMAISGADAATWYVATDGSDGAAGTSAAPFATWQRAFDRSRRGDTILIGPGVYQPARQGTGAILTGKQNITIMSHGGTPILDCSDVTYPWGIRCLRIERSSNIRVVGIEVRNTPQLSNNTWPAGIKVDDVRGGSLENVRSHHNEGTGIMIVGDTRDFKLVNCDAHHNFQPFPNGTGPGGDSDGISMSVESGNSGNSITGCRAWNNGDDGVDLWNSESVVEIEGNWSWGNGVAPDGSEAGDGVGFKLGKNSSAPRHWVAHNLAWRNKLAGFDTNNGGALDLVNNTAWDNGYYNFAAYGAAHSLRNNLSVGSKEALSGPYTASSNSWNLGGADADDFASMSANGVDGDRNSDGTLPDLPFLKLAGTSDMIDAGEDVGEEFIGAAPDIGAYEFDAVVPPPPPPPPPGCEDPTA